jgi:hypothetical protein
MPFASREAKELRNQSKTINPHLVSRSSKDDANSYERASSQTQIASAVQRAKANPNQVSSQDVLLLQNALGNRKTSRLLGRTPQSVPTVQASSGVEQRPTGASVGGFAPDIDSPGQEPDTVLGGITQQANASLTVNRDPTDVTATTATPTATPAPTAPATTIASTTVSGPTWNANGAFDWRVGFSTTGRSGWIVQEIVNTYVGQDASGGSIATGVVPHYWEAWAVGATGAVTPAASGVNDFWLRPNKGPSTKGNWSMAGKLFFTTTDPATQGFTAGGVSNAGILLSSTSQPTGLGSTLLTRQANGKWDSIKTPAEAHAGTAN